VGLRALAPLYLVLRIRRLGRVGYDEAHTLQRALARQSRDDYVMLLEHPHVYTLGVRADRRHILVDPVSVGAALIQSDRGGDVTYHGPGQLVVYPVVAVPDEPGVGPVHVHRVEEMVIAALTDLDRDGVLGRVGRLEGFPGVWVNVDGLRPRKVAAIGVRTVRNEDGVRKTLHGVAINVRCDLTMFSHIVPCGLTDMEVTSLNVEGLTVTMDEVAEAIISRAIEIWGHGGGVDRQDVVTGRVADIGVEAAAQDGSESSGVPPSRTVAVALGQKPERPLIRRLRQAGVEPDQSVPIAQRKPSWLRLPVKMGQEYLGLGRTVHDLGLVTVCEEAGCPNIYECWSEGTATFMVNGSRCTRACGFCQVDTRHPLPLDLSEPDRVAQAVARMQLEHAVVTCVARDDLSDGGAGAIASTIAAVRKERPTTSVEVLISDCKGDAKSLDLVFDARPDVMNHNIETVARLQRAVRPSAGYARSLGVLARANEAGLMVKSGLMVGLGESESEVVSTMADLLAVGVSIVTIGQYLRPSMAHLPVARYWEPSEFDHLKRMGESMGLAHVESSPLTRSSYHAGTAAQAVGATPHSRSALV
jgi:lipoyl synthase